MTHADGYLIRFEDGPLARSSNISTLAGTLGNFTIAKDLFGWPLPDRLGALTHPEALHIAFWDAEDPKKSGLPDVILDSPNAIVYRKVSQSQLDTDVPYVMRGAAYCLEVANGGT